MLDAQAPLGEGEIFKYEPERMLYAYEWLHKGTPADYRLVLTRDSAMWFEYVTALLLAALNREAPHLFEELHAVMAQFTRH